MLLARPRGETGNRDLRPVICSVQRQADQVPALPPGTAVATTSDPCGLSVCGVPKRSQGGRRISPLRQQRPPLWKIRHAWAAIQGSAASTEGGPRTSKSRRRPIARGTRNGCPAAAHRVLSSTVSPTSARFGPNGAPAPGVVEWAPRAQAGQPAPGSLLTSSIWQSVNWPIRQNRRREARGGADRRVGGGGR